MTGGQLGVSYRVERIARFLHLNYPTDCCRVPWADIDQDCRDGWLAEAEVIYTIAVGKSETYRHRDG